MKQDISNKTLVAILAFSLVLSLGGTFFTISKITNQNPELSGYATSDVGTAQITISSDASILLVNDTINFGTGYVNTSIGACATGKNATIWTGTNGAPTTPGNLNSCWTNGTTNDDFVVRSLANKAINVTIQSDKNATEFLASDVGDTPETTPEFQYQTYDHNTTGGCNDGGATEIASWTEFDKNQQVLCSGATGNMTFFNDEIGVTIRVVVPAGVTGLKTSTLTFNSVIA